MNHGLKATWFYVPKLQPYKLKSKMSLSMSGILERVPLPSPILSVKCSYYQNSQTAVAVITKYYRLSGLNNGNLLLIVLETGSPRGHQGRFSSEVSPLGFWSAAILIVFIGPLLCVYTGERETEISQFSSVAQASPTLFDPLNHSTPRLPVHHQLPEFTQIHVHQVSDAIQPSHALLSPFP